MVPLSFERIFINAGQKAAVWKDACRLSCAPANVFAILIVTKYR